MAKLWNPLTGSLLYNIPTQHNKTITSLCYSTAITNFPTMKIHHRLLTSSLDGLIRIHALDSLYATSEDEIDIPFVFGMKVPNQTNITAMAMSPCQTRLVIGTSTGHLIIHQRAKYVIPTTKKRPLKQPKAGTYAYFMRGVHAPPNKNNSATDDHIVITDKKRRLTKFDRSLKTFSYADALDEALNSRDPKPVLAVLEELGKRKGLLIALSNRDEETLEPILAFITMFIARPQYSSVLIGVAHLLCDIYSSILGQSDVIDEYFTRLQTYVQQECTSQKTLLQIVGQIDAILYTAYQQEKEDSQQYEDES